MKSLVDHGLDPIGLSLGFGERAYHRYTSPYGIDGLARWTKERIDLLAIVSTSPGQGRLRAFIANLKRQFTTIGIWEVWNPDLEAALIRYGFTPQTEIQGDGEVISGLRWDKP